MDDNYTNLIDDNGNHGPFVYRGEDGIHVGDDDNDDVFETVEEAIESVKKFRLSGGELSIARSHAERDYRDNIAAEYHWHQDAGLQLDALRRLFERRSQKGGRKATD